jgi:acetylornithine deacetylase
VNLIELTKTLVDIPSATGFEAEIADFLAAYLRSLEFEVREQVLEGKRRNILALLQPRPRVMFCTHLDTVPPFFAAREDESYIYGRGACDAKGIMAAMISAGQELGREGRSEVGLLLVAGEETDSIGAKKANDLNVDSAYIVVGEPTQNKMGCGHKGQVTLRITAAGKSAHSAFPGLGQSAVEKLIDVLQEIRLLNLGDDPAWGETLVNIGKIEGGVAPNVIPDKASAIVSLRSGRASDRIRKTIERACGQKVKLEVLSSSEPQVLFTLPGYEQTVLPYATDVPYLRRFGKKLLLGPGSAEVAHTEHENVEKRQLFEAVGLYKKLARELLEH